MRKFFLDTALLPAGWASDVLISCTQDGRIADVAPGVPCPSDAEHLQGTAIPGIANLHSHAHQRAIAGLGERSGNGEDSFWSWREAMYRAVARMTPEDFQAIATQLYIEMLKSGFTRVAEFHYLHHDRDGAPFADPAEMSKRVVAAARTAGIGLTLLPVLYATSGFGGAPAVESQRRFAHSLEGFLRLMQSLRGEAGIVLGVAPHSLRAVPPAMLTELIQATPDGPIHIHIAEQQREVQECRAHTGKRPVEWLLEHAQPGARWCLIHATHVMPAEIAGMAQSGAVVGLCPTTEANLGDGIFPAAEFLRLGGRFGIGSDSHISVSPVEDLRWLEYAQRLTTHRRAVLANDAQRSTGRRLVEDAARGGAAACGADDASIAPGGAADIVVLDTTHPLLVARQGDALLDSWIFAGNAPLVRHVIVGGKVMIRDFRHAKEEDVARNFRSAMQRLAA
jgi:formimidoylglutamate deiminase